MSRHPVNRVQTMTARKGALTGGAKRAPRPRRAAAAARRSRELAIAAARIADQNNCEEIVVLDLRGVSPVCDYFVIATGTSDRQMRAVADHIVEAAREAGDRPLGVSGLTEGTWIVIDFVDTVVHIFDPQHRRFYDLEMLWGDAPRVRWKRPARAAKKAGEAQAP